MATATEGNAESEGGRWGSGRRMAAWCAAVLLLLMLPLLAMQVTGQVDWDVFDFAVVGALLIGAGVSYELAARMTASTAYRAAAGVALAAVFLLAWVIGAVGVIADSGDPADLMYGGVIAVGIIGAVLARFQAHGVARALFAMALAQALVGAIALVAGMVPAYNSAYEILGLNGLFAALFVGSAALFRRAARERPPAEAGPEA